MYKKNILVFTVLFALLIGNLFSQTVVVCNGQYATKYHNSFDCRGLNNCKGGVYDKLLKEAINMGRTACSICNPPTLIESAPPKNSEENQNLIPAQRKNTSSVQCIAITKAGVRCKRMTKSANGKCWQHGGE